MFSFDEFFKKIKLKKNEWGVSAKIWVNSPFVPAHILQNAGRNLHFGEKSTCGQRFGGLTKRFSRAITHF